MAHFLDLNALLTFLDESSPTLCLQPYEYLLKVVFEGQGTDFLSENITRLLRIAEYEIDYLLSSVSGQRTLAVTGIHNLHKLGVK